MTDHGTDNCTPTTEAMKELAVWAACQAGPDHLRPAEIESEARRHWDAWLAAHEAQVLRDAAARIGIYAPQTYVPLPGATKDAQNWLFAEADRISEGGRDE